MHKSKVTIVGAGIPGLSLALILAKAGYDITIVDKNKLPTQESIKPSGRTTALMQASIKILERAGVWPEFKEQCTSLSRISIIDDSAYPRGSGSMIREDFLANELGLAEFGYNVPLTPMAGALADLVKANTNIMVLEGAKIDQNHKVIQQAGLVVGADGRHSIVRKWAGIEANIKKYDQTAITCVISHSQPHEDTSIEFHRSGGPCTFVPHGDNQSAVVWVEKDADAEEFLKLPRDGFVQALQDRSRGLLGKIDLVIEPESWPLMTLKADKLIAQKTVLIAEAAHVLSPIGAQGLNLSLRDVGALTDIIINTKQDIGSMDILKRYERNRRRDMMPRHFGVDMLNQMVANDNRLVCQMRRFGLRAVRHIKPLRQFLMEQGLSPEV